MCTSFFTIGRIIGLNLSRKLFSILFSIIAPIFKSKKIIKKNLKIFNKNISKLEEDTIISNVWKNYGKTFIEYIFLDIFRKESSHIKIYGKENLERIKRIKKPVVFISGHFSNFELMSISYNLIYLKTSLKFNISMFMFSAILEVPALPGKHIIFLVI